MIHNRTAVTAIVCCLVVAGAATAGDVVVDLDATWNFALDPGEKGEHYGWNAVPEDWDGAHWLNVSGWDKVAVPHDYLSDPRYHWTGVAWYRKSVDTPDGGPGAVYRLQFDRIGSKCDVWVNGHHAGHHNGGYTPFEFDISDLVRRGRYNHVAIKVDNRRAVGDNPGPRMNAKPAAQLIPWLNFGGILRSTRLVVSPAVYVERQKVATTPTLPHGPAAVSIAAFVRNTSSAEQSITIGVELASDDDGDSIIAGDPPSRRVTVPPSASHVVEFQLSIGEDQVRLWSPDSPALYRSRIRVTANDDESGEHVHEDTFGIRSIDVRDGHFLLNGEPVRLAGANRAEGHPDFGGLEPSEVVDHDLGLMKRAHLELHRLQHYPPSRDVMDWADRNGMLVIVEAPSWGLGPTELSDERYRSNFKAQLTELIESNWNHPSVVAWSVGNEYQSWTAEGVDWTRTFDSVCKHLDSSRPTTFCALGYAPSSGSPVSERRSMHWVDFVCINFYTSGKHAGQVMDQIHERWPDKPILISEYGKRADQATEAQRIAHFHDTLTAVRSRDFVMGLSYWSFNDYRSQFPGTNVSGYRPWGIVGPDREPRELYSVMQSELAPADVKVVQQSPLRIEVSSRSDFPTMTLRDYRARLLDSSGETVEETGVPTLEPGESTTVEFAAANFSRVQLIRPTGFVCAELSAGD